MSPFQRVLSGLPFGFIGQCTKTWIMRSLRASLRASVSSASALASPSSPSHGMSTPLEHFVNSFEAHLLAFPRLDILVRAKTLKKNQSIHRMKIVLFVVMFVLVPYALVNNVLIAIGVKVPFCPSDFPLFCALWIPISSSLMLSYAFLVISTEYPDDDSRHG